MSTPNGASCACRVAKPTLKPGVTQWLAQGTIYPDAIESAGARTGKAHLIKFHHNVGGLADYLKLELPEPLRELLRLADDIFIEELRKHDLYGRPARLSPCSCRPSPSA